MKQELIVKLERLGFKNGGAYKDWFQLKRFAVVFETFYLPFNHPSYNAERNTLKLIIL